MALIGVGLGEEDPGLIRIEPALHRGHLGLVERRGQEDVEETTGEVAQRARHLARGPGLAVDAEHGCGPRLETGRSDLTSAVLARAVCAVLYVAEGPVDVDK